MEELNRQANEVSKSIGKAKDAAEREKARKKQGRQLRDRPRRPRPPWKRSPPRPTPSCGRSPICRTPRHRSAPTTRPIWKCAAASTPLRKFDFKPLDHVELGEQLDLIDFEGRRQGRRPRLLLPQERRRAAGAGPAALRARPADSPKASRRRSRPTWPATKCWKASASCRAGRKRRSTASTTAT